MGQAEIGSLRVLLGMDTAQFQEAAKRAQSVLGGLGGAVKAFAATAIAGLSLGALKSAVQSAAEHMDELGKASQKIGIPVEMLSKLEYAAKLSDVPLEDLTSSLAKLDKALAEIGGGKHNDAEVALRALGVSAVDANGKLRPTKDVMDDVAQAFSRYEDGANKTAAAQALFGKAGANMIPLLNTGKQGLADAAAEAERFGLVVDDKAAAAAERFNDNLTRLGEMGRGVANKLTEALLPALSEATDVLVTLFEKAGDASSFFGDLQTFMQRTVEEAMTFGTAFEVMGVRLETFGKTVDHILNQTNGSVAEWQEAQKQINQMWADNSAKIAMMRLGDQLGPPKGLMQSDGGSPTKPDAPTMDFGHFDRVKKAATEAARAFAKLKAEGMAVFDETRTPLEKYQAELQRLNGLLDKGVINQDTYNRAVAAAQDEFDQTAQSIRTGLNGAVGQAQQEMERLNKLFREGTIDQPLYQRAIANLEDEFAGVQQAAQDVANQLQDTFGSAFEGLIDKAIDGSFDFLDVLKDLSKQLLHMATNRIFDFLWGGGAVAPSQAGGGLGGLLGGLGSLFGFAQGGSFQVGGSGGIDSQLVAFRATPSERVTITNPGQDGFGTSVVKVQIVDQRSNAPAIEQRRGADGSLAFIIKDAINNHLGNGSADSAMAARYGLGPKNRRS